MEKKLLGFVVVSFALLTIGCACPSYKRAVKTWSSAHTKVYVKYVMEDTKNDPDEKAQEYMTISGLPCTIDEDEKTSTPANKSAACKCARPTNADTRKQDCESWAQAVTGQQ